MDEEEREEPPPKYARIRLASPSPEKSEGTESIHSWQGYETELAKGTGDSTSPPINFFEYDVVSDTDSENCRLVKKKFYSSDDSDEEDNDTTANKIFSEVSGDNLGDSSLADASVSDPTSPTSNSDVDPELPRSDYLDFEKCLLCETKEKNICFPYCSTCFTLKKNLFPDRPKKFKNRLKKENTHTSPGVPLNQDNRISDENTINSESQLTEAVVGRPQSAKDISNSQLPEDVERASKEYSPASISTPSTSTSTSTPNALKLTANVCRICFSKPENGLFVHTNVAHVYGCYSCAKKIMHRNGGCPLCRRKIFKVAKLFVQ